MKIGVNISEKKKRFVVGEECEVTVFNGMLRFQTQTSLPANPALAAASDVVRKLNEAGIQAGVDMFHDGSIMITTQRLVSRFISDEAAQELADETDTKLEQALGYSSGDSVTSGSWYLGFSESNLDVLMSAMEQALLKEAPHRYAVKIWIDDEVVVDPFADNASPEVFSDLQDAIESAMCFDLGFEVYLDDVEDADNIMVVEVVDLDDFDAGNLFWVNSEGEDGSDLAENDPSDPRCLVIDCNPREYKESDLKTTVKKLRIAQKFVEEYFNAWFPIDCHIKALALPERIGGILDGSISISNEQFEAARPLFEEVGRKDIAQMRIAMQKIANILYY